MASKKMSSFYNSFLKKFTMKKRSKRTHKTRRTRRNKRGG